MSYPAYEMPVYVRGTLVESVMHFFSDQAQTVPGDPTTVTATVLAPAGIPLVTYTYGVGGEITRQSTGVYSLEVDTTPTNGEWVVYWAGTGVIQYAFEDRWIVTSQV